MAPNTEDFNKDELNAPKWLNEEFFTNVLRNQQNNVNIKNFKITPGSGKGDHYASVMFRATVEYALDGNDKTKSFIIKTMPEYEGTKMNMLGESHVFETEIGMYTEVIPKFEQILRDAGDKTVLSPPCVYHSLSPKKVIVFEDIVPYGYEVLRGRSTNMEEVKAAYTKIAKWHAVSYKVSQEDPAYFDQYRHSFMTMPNVFELEFLRDGLENFLNLLERVPSLRMYKPYFETLRGKHLQEVQESFTEYRENKQSNGIYVLCHGDYHVKNMMFKFNSINGGLEDVLLLDFQLSYMGPIVNDIMYSFFMLLDDDMRKNHKDELIYFYFSTFLETLKIINYKGVFPKLVDFRQQLLRHKKFELFLLYSFLPIFNAFKMGNVDTDDLVDSKDTRKNLYDNPDYINELHTLLPRYLHLGYFEN